MGLLTFGIGLLIGSALLSAILCALIRVVAPRLGLVDRPGGRKAHARPTPLGGGVAIWATLTIAFVLGYLALAVRAPLPEALAIHAEGLLTKAPTLALLMGLSTLIMLMGLLDDRFGLPWQIRLGIQFGLATLFVLIGDQARVSAFTSNVGLMSLLTVVWIVGLTNAFNFLDNMDGLAGGVGLIAAALFVWAQLAVGSLFVPVVLIVLVGALSGFLIHNNHPARLFMGDAGSNYLGFLLGCLTVLGTFTRPDYSPYSVIVPVLVMAVPLYDSISVILIRIREGRSPFQADRSHFSHRLRDLGLSVRQAVGSIYLVTLAGGLGALLLHQVNAVGAVVIVAQTLVLIGLIALWEVARPRPELRNWESKQEPGADATTTVETQDGSTINGMDPLRHVSEVPGPVRTSEPTH